jgi:WD40 repeat protein
VTKLEGWTQAVDISGAGDPVFIVDRNIHLLARHDGTVLERAQISCSLRGRLRFITADTAVTACDDAIVEIGLPGLTVRRAYAVPNGRTIDSGIRGFDVQATGVAYGTGSGTVVVLTRDGDRYVPGFSISRDAMIESLALSPDLRTLVVGFESRGSDDPSSIEIFDLGSGKSVATVATADRSRVTAMSFSPDGSMTFAHAGSFEAGIIDVAAATWKRNYRVGSWVSETVWVRPDLVAGAGSDGISLFPVDGGDTIVLEVPGHQYPTMEAVGASDDGSMFCTGERDGTVGCWTNQPLAPSSYQPRAPLVR